MSRSKSFISLSEVRVKLLLQSKQAPERNVFTDKEGVFTFSGIAPGEYTVRVDSQAFISVEIHNIHIGEAEDRHLRRILLEAGQGYGNCVVRVHPRSGFQHTSAKDIEISGRALIGSGESAVVTLVVFTEKEALTRSAVSDSKGRFQFVVAVAGDIRLRIETRNRSGKTVIHEERANMGRADLGDRIAVPRIKLMKSGLGHFCY